MNKFNKEAGYDKYDSRIVDMVPAGPRAREKILDLKEKKTPRDYATWDNLIPKNTKSHE